MNIGALRERVTIQAPTFTTDPIGGQVEVEGAPVTVVADLPAAVESLGVGQERILVGQLRGVANVKVTIRYRDDVTTAMRVLWGTKVLEIGMVDYQGVVETHLYCAEVQS